MSRLPDDVAAGVAIIGMSGRFPGAATVEQLWANLRAGVESVSFFSEEELLAAGCDPVLLADRRYVKASPVLAGVDRFDAPFFGFNPGEAEILDPQQRLFLECAWATLESAGYDPESYAGSIGLFAGAGLNAYLWENLAHRPEILRSQGPFQLLIGNEKDYLATRTAYALNLRGPSLSVQTACSTALVAVHLGCQAVLDYHCDMALAGAVRIAVPQMQGYLAEEGGITSPDGHCRPFDARAQGTLFGSGVGAVLLKRLEDALADGDTIRAVIRGTAVNNDGALKVGFTAPGVDGQTRVVAEALAAAGIDPDTVSLVEAHGTATPLGDPIEVEALTRAFRARTRRRGFCALGSVKSNLGHLDAAAGIAGLIKTVLALEHRQIPPSLHFETPNPQIDFAASPFFVNDRLRDWESDGRPRRAGVSSFGIGGTNAHVVLEEAPPAPAPAPFRPWQLLLLSARTAAALETAAAGLADHLRRAAAGDLPDIAFTLQTGRRRFEHRRAVVCRTAAEAADALAGCGAVRVLSHSAGPRTERPVAFLFPGQGAQHPGMGRELYRFEAVFRRAVDRSAEILLPLLGLDLRTVLYPAAGAAERLRRTDLAQAALFTVEHALARLWMSWGVAPQALIGHSIGEYVAACLAGVFSLEDALALVAVRGRLMRGLPAGAMLGVPLPAAALSGFLGGDLDLAAINGEELSVVSGPEEAVERCRRDLAARGIEARRLHTSHAFHSRSMDAIREPFAREVGKRALKAPQIPFVSNLTGTWIRPEEATDPGYWVRHLREPVRFAAGIGELLREPGRVLLEAGPGRTLAGLARRHPSLGPSHAVVTSLPGPQDVGDDLPVLLDALARLWLAGVEIDWPGFSAGEKRRRVPLPTYPFERLRYWIDPSAAARRAEGAPAAAGLETTAEPAATPAGPRAAHPRPLVATEWVAPRDEWEGRVAELWQEKLGVEPIGVHDDFFELGGHSLLATRIAAEVRRAFGADLPLRELFATPTVAHMASRLAACAGQRAEVNGADRLPLLVPQPLDAHEPFPLTDVQGAYWIGRGDAFELGSVATHSYSEVESRGIDLERFTRALRLLIARHGMLRAVMLPDGRQRVLPAVPPYEVALLDLGGMAPEEAERQLLAVREQMSHQVIPGDRWPLFEVRASRLPDGRLRLHVSFDFLIGDAWSVRFLITELQRLYADPASLPPPPQATFRDYVLAEASLAEGGLVRRSLEYWRHRLDTLPPPPELPLVASPGGLAQVRFTRRGGSLEAAAWERFKACAARSGVTPSVAVLAAFAEVLAAWSKSPRFTLNLTLFNRLPLHPEVDRIVGDFTSLTLLEVDTSRGETFEARIRQIQQRLWDDLDHRYVSGVRVMRELAQARREAGMAAPVVFTSMLNLRSGDEAGDAGEAVGEGPQGLPLSGVYGVSQTPQVWLDHQVSEQEGRLVLVWDAVEELFPAGLLDDMLAVYLALLERLAAGEEAWREAAPLRLPAAHLALYAAANPMAPMAGIALGLLHEPFLAQARQRPESPAVLSAEKTLRYGELGRLASGLGRRLRAAGVAPGSLVGVVMTKGWEQAVAVLGALAAGAAYLPVDADLPQERRDYLLSQGGVRVALTQARHAALAWPEGVSVLVVDGAAGEDGPWPAPRQDAGDLAYTIFTSGSTGLPKGVMIEHRSAFNTVVEVNRRFAVGPEDRVLGVSSLSFDLSVYDLFGLWAAGGAVVLPEATAGRDPARWLELMERFGVTVWNTVPALLEMLVEYAEGRGARLPGALRLVLLSGDWLPLSLPARLRSLAAGPVEVVSLGGATEASIWSILYPVREVDPGWRSIPYGRAMAGQSFQVLDADLAPRPVWVPGELYIGGAGLARGYWRDPVKTAASFVASPGTGERLYRTGDLGRWLPDGTIEFLGREDFQVKIQGHRIELGEIEAALAAHPAIETAVVTAPGERGKGRRLVGYAVPAAGQAVAIEDLRAWLAGKLPGYMVPAVLVAVAALPLTPNGKVDRRALPEPGEAPGEGRGDAAGLHTPVEELLAGIWEEVLGVPAIAADQDFYALGGDSLLATRVVSRVRERLGADVSLRAFFAEPTLAGVARRVAAALGTPALQAPPLVVQPRQGDLPLSFGQERLWLVDQLAPGSPVYNEAFTVRIAAPLDRRLLERSLDEVVRRHEALRTTFAAREGLPRQVIGPAEPVRLPVVDLRFVPATERLPRARRLAAELARRPFDLAAGPLLSTSLLRLDDSDHLLVLVLHHIVCDAWSVGILLREVTALYAAFRDGAPSPLPEPAVQYADFALWQRAWLRGEVLEAQLSWWRKRLGGDRPPLRLPTRPRPAVPSLRAADETVHLPADLLHGLRELGRQGGATLFMTLLAALQTLLHRYSGADEITVGSPIANRQRIELEPLIGFFTNTLVLRTDLSGNPTFRALLGRVREVSLGAYGHQDVPFERLVEALKPERTAHATPFFRVLFVLQNAPLPESDPAGLGLSLLAAGDQAAPKFDLTLWAAERSGGLVVSFLYDVDVFESSTVAEMLARFMALLERVADDPDQRLLDIPLAAGEVAVPAVLAALPSNERFSFEL